MLLLHHPQSKFDRAHGWSGIATAIDGVKHVEFELHVFGISRLENEIQVGLALANGVQVVVARPRDAGDRCKIRSAY